MHYRSVEWHTGSDGLLKEIAVEYEQTFWQWLFRKPATKRRWRIESQIDGSSIERSVEDPKRLKKSSMPYRISGSAIWQNVAGRSCRQSRICYNVGIN